MRDEPRGGEALCFFAVNVSHSAISFLCAAGGAIPGIVIGFGLRFVQDKLAGSAPKPT